jgi:hypothetical protein
MLKFGTTFKTPTLTLKRKGTPHETMLAAVLDGRDESQALPKLPGNVLQELFSSELIMEKYIS